MARKSTKTTARRATKTSRKAAVKGATRAPRTVKNADSKITHVDSENPRRAGSVQATRYALLQKFKGKTVGAFIAGGGDRDALRYAVAGGYAKVSK